jgi:hypothetical protein
MPSRSNCRFSILYRKIFTDGDQLMYAVTMLKGLYEVEEICNSFLSRSQLHRLGMLKTTRFMRGGKGSLYAKEEATHKHNSFVDYVEPMKEACRSHRYATRRNVGR